MPYQPLKGSDFIKSRSFKDISVGLFRNYFTSDVSEVKDAEAIKQSIKNIVLTNPSEKLFNPNFGSSVGQLLFEQLDPFLMDSIQSEILNTIRNYEKRVIVTNILCIPDYDTNSISVDLEYQIVGLPTIESIQFVLQRP